MTSRVGRGGKRTEGQTSFITADAARLFPAVAREQVCQFMKSK